LITKEHDCGATTQLGGRTMHGTKAMNLIKIVRLHQGVCGDRGVWDRTGKLRPSQTWLMPEHLSGHVAARQIIHAGSKAGVPRKAACRTKSAFLPIFRGS
jgi:hypothetical protein